MDQGQEGCWHRGRRGMGNVTACDGTGFVARDFAKIFHIAATASRPASCGSSRAVVARVSQGHTVAATWPTTSLLRVHDPDAGEELSSRAVPSRQSPYSTVANLRRAPLPASPPVTRTTDYSHLFFASSPPSRLPASGGGSNTRSSGTELGVPYPGDGNNATVAGRGRDEGEEEDAEEHAALLAQLEEAFAVDRGGNQDHAQALDTIQVCVLLRGRNMRPSLSLPLSATAVGIGVALGRGEELIRRKFDELAVLAPEARAHGDPIYQLSVKQNMQWLATCPP